MTTKCGPIDWMLVGLQGSKDEVKPGHVAVATTVVSGSQLVTRRAARAIAVGEWSWSLFFADPGFKVRAEEARRWDAHGKPDGVHRVCIGTLLPSTAHELIAVVKNNGAARRLLASLFIAVAHDDREHAWPEPYDALPLSGPEQLLPRFPCLECGTDLNRE